MGNRMPLNAIVSHCLPSSTVIVLPTMAEGLQWLTLPSGDDIGGFTMMLDNMLDRRAYWYAG